MPIYLEFAPEKVINQAPKEEEEEVVNEEDAE
jgi:multiple RNA-binding domain-containing protein 1